MMGALLLLLLLLRAVLFDLDANAAVLLFPAPLSIGLAIALIKRSICLSIVLDSLVVFRMSDTILFLSLID
jgi:hypothetical protein